MFEYVLFSELIFSCDKVCCMIYKKEWATGHTYEWSGLPPNYDDIEESADSPMGETVEIDQSDPQSNAIHIAHNIPTGSKVSPLYFPDA